MCRGRGQHLLFAINKVAGVEGRDFKSVPVRNGICRAGFDTVSTEDTAVVVDVVDLGIAFGAAHSLLFGVLRSFDINAIGGAGRSTQEAGYALLQTVLVTLQDMDSTKAFLELSSFKWARAVG